MGNSSELTKESKEQSKGNEKEFEVRKYLQIDLIQIEIKNKIQQKIRRR